MRLLSYPPLTCTWIYHTTMSYSVAMATALLGHMEVAGQEGMVAKVLLDWYLTSDNYRVPARAAEMKSQLMNVIRRMIKRDKSIVAVKSTVKGSKRIEDMLLRIPARPVATASNDNNELKVIDATASAASIIAGQAVENDQVVNLRKQIEEKKAALLAKAATQESEGDDVGKAKSDDHPTVDPSIVRK